MTTLLDKPTARLEHLALRHARLPRWAPLLVIAVSLAASGILALLLGLGPVAVAIVAALIYLVALPSWSRVVENRRAATDRAMTALVWVALVIAFVPLVSLMWTVLSQGVPALDAKFFTWSMRNVVGEKGGVYHAIIGTLLITGAAAVISIPVGLLSAIYLVEYGATSRRSWPVCSPTRCSWCSSAPACTWASAARSRSRC